MPLTDETQQLLAELRALDRPSLQDVSITEARRYQSLEHRFMGELQPVASVSYDVATSSVGAVPLRLYRPNLQGPHEIIVYLHGGGWALGGIALHDASARRLCRATNSAVLSVDYHLAPEHPYPAPLEDCYAALEWLVARAEHEEIDATRLVLLGDSAGGNLAAALAIQARDRGGPPIAAQVLIYPALDPRCESDTYSQFELGYLCEAADSRYCWQLYLNGASEERYAAPISVADCSDLPRALVITAECDVLRDEGELYASRLARAGVPVQANRFVGTVHGFWTYAGALTAAKAADAQIARFLRGESDAPAAADAGLATRRPSARPPMIVDVLPDPRNE